MTKRLKLCVGQAFNQMKNNDSLGMFAATNFGIIANGKQRYT
jgi:hypothetical protein